MLNLFNKITNVFSAEKNNHKIYFKKGKIRQEEADLKERGKAQKYLWRIVNLILNPIILAYTVSYNLLKYYLPVKFYLLTTLLFILVSSEVIPFKNDVI